MPCRPSLKPLSWTWVDVADWFRKSDFFTIGLSSAVSMCVTHLYLKSSLSKWRIQVPDNINLRNLPQALSSTTYQAEQPTTLLHTWPDVPVCVIGAACAIGRAPYWPRTFFMRCLAGALYNGSRTEAQCCMMSCSVMNAVSDLDKPCTSSFTMIPSGATLTRSFLEGPNGLLRQQIGLCEVTIPSSVLIRMYNTSMRLSSTSQAKGYQLLFSPHVARVKLMDKSECTLVLLNHKTGEVIENLTIKSGTSLHVLCNVDLFRCPEYEKYKQYAKITKYYASYGSTCIIDALQGKTIGPFSMSDLATPDDVLSTWGLCSP